MNTPEEIAERAARLVLERNNIVTDPEEVDPNENPLVTLGFEMGKGITYERAMIELVTASIELNRAQHNLIECIARALDNRGAKDAAQLVRDTDPDDDLWNNYVGPMLDSIEDDYTHMARED